MIFELTNKIHRKLYIIIINNARLKKFCSIPPGK